jgi:D-alanyl-D-alanine dipeptidase
MWAASSRLLRLIEKGDILPTGFVYLDEVIADAIYDVRYYTDNNFIGSRVDGYMVPRVILTSEAANALAGVAEEFRQKGLLLKIFDGYRPQQAVNNFVRWAADIDDKKMKPQYYPDVDKKDLFRLRFIAEKSGHSRGSTVDLTLIDALTGEELDMASGFDFFGEISHHDSALISPQQLQNRNLLRDTMVRHGFEPYPEEWWHYTLAAEPYPYLYFDFPVR